MKENYCLRLITILFLLGLVFFQSCNEKNPLVVQGNIEGVITDAETAETLNGVNVTIVSNSSTTFAEQSKLTGSDGKFSYKDLEAGNYKLTFTKSGYESNSKNISLAAGQTSSSDISLKPIKPVLSVSATNLDFGQSENILPVEIRNTGKGELTWTVVENLNWVAVNPASGKTTTEVSSVSVSVDRSLITSNSQTGSIVINSNGGSALINLTVGKAGPLMNVTPSMLDFGGVEIEKSLSISNAGIGSLTFEATASQSWITLDGAKGSVATDIKNINVKVNREGLTPGGYNGNVIINSSSNSVTIPVTMAIIQPSAPQVLNGQASNITYTAAQVSGIIATLGSSVVTQHGHCWSTSPNPTTTNNKTTLGGTNVTNSFTSNLAGLSANTLYYVKAYATNSIGTGYSDAITFTTPATPTMPTVQTISTSNVGLNSIDITGNLTVLGDGLVTDYGFCYSASAVTPTTGNSKVSKGQTTQTGQYTATLTNLQASTKYYIRAYATNSMGTAYGTVIEATTTNGAPIVTSGLVAYYTFDDSNCNEAQGKTGFNGVKQGNGNPVYSTDTPGKSGKSLQLDNDASFQISKSPFNGITAEYTSSVWIKTMTNRTTLFHHPEYCSPGIQIWDSYIYNLNYSSSAEPDFGWKFDIQINGLLLDGNWHLLTITSKPGVFKLYIDGTYYSQCNAYYGSLSATDPMRLGYGFTGKMDNFRVYNRELKQSEITELYNAKQ